MLLLPVAHALGAHRATVGPADVLLGLGEPPQNLRSNSPNLQDKEEYNCQKRADQVPTITFQRHAIVFKSRGTI